MLSRLPGPLHRIALRFAHALRIAWWGIRRPEVRGCTVIVAKREREVLLVRHSYQSPHKWMLPGGGIARGESPERAAIREVAEETGCRIVAVHCFAVETVALWGARNHIHLVAAETSDDPVPDGREIVAATFFATTALPATLADAARSRIERWRVRDQNSES